MEAVIETFKPVRGYEGLYEVSDYGAVRSLNYNKTGKRKILQNVKFPSGYLVVCLHLYGKQRNFRVHRLVWEAFVGTIPDGMEIDHIDGDKTNNLLSNLRVVTPKQNQLNPITRERHLKAMSELWESDDFRNKRIASIKSLRSKPILQLDKSTGEVIREWECAADASRELGINFRNISACCQEKRNSAGGYRWRFAQ